MSNRKPNSAQARDVMFHLHSQTNPRRRAEIGPLIINAAEIDELLGLFARTLRQVEDRLGARSAASPLAVPRSRH